MQANCCTVSRSGFMPGLISGFIDTATVALYYGRRICCVPHPALVVNEATSLVSGSVENTCFTTGNIVGRATAPFFAFSPIWVPGALMYAEDEDNLTGRYLLAFGLGMSSIITVLFSKVAVPLGQEGKCIPI